jgi:hypothetical protein
VLPAAVQEVTDRYLAAVDAALPGAVSGLYLIGSIALDDFHPGVSDIDFVAVTAAPVDFDTEEALAAVHAQVGADGGQPAMEGPYVTFDQLQASPTLAAAGPFFHDGSLESGRQGRTPIEWVTLARHGMALRGPDPGALNIATDAGELADWTLNNLDRYWADWVARSRGATPTAMAMLTDWGVAWGVLGVSRLHYTLATGQITSKTGAGNYALFAFPPRWHGIVRQALRCRAHPPGPPASMEAAMQRRDEATEFMDFVIEAARASASASEEER